MSLVGGAGQATMACTALVVAALVGGPGPTHPNVDYDPRLFGRAWAAVQASPAQPLPGARVLVVPHHWVAGALILDPLRNLAATRPITRVILVGPDHPNAGGDQVTTSDWPWATPFGMVTADSAFVGHLTGNGLASRAPNVLTQEHSVAGLMPAIARTLPGATVVPLIVRGDASARRLAALAAAIAPGMDEGTVLVASIDFAHDVSVRAVPRLNAESVAALAALDERRVLAWGNEHLDAPEVAALAMDVARRVGARRFNLVASSDASRFGAPASQPVTSYVVGWYR